MLQPGRDYCPQTARLGQARLGMVPWEWTVVLELSITRGKKCRKGVRKDDRKRTWVWKKEHLPLGLQLVFEGSWGVIETTEHCYTVAWRRGIVPNRDPKRLAASRNEGADPWGTGAA